MASELDRRLDAAIGAITGADGPLRVRPAGHGDPVAGTVTVADLPRTLPGLLDHFCALHGAKTALVADAERLSFAELAVWADRVAQAFAGGWGVRKGDRIAITMHNCPAWIVVAMGALKAGAILVAVNGWWQARELAAGIGLTSPAMIVADGVRADRIGAADIAVPVVTLAIEAELAEALRPLLDGIASAVPPRVTPADDATILFTSGSTGEAKGVVSTHDAVTTAAYGFFGNALALRRAMIDTEPASPYPPATLLAVPLFHVTGLVAVLLNSIAIGRKMVVMPKWDAGAALRLIAAERINFFTGVPTMSLDLMQHPDRAAHDLSSLRDLSGGGAARPVAHVARLIDCFPGAAPMLGYGLTETNAVGSNNARANYAAKPASAGRPQAPFVHIAIFAPDGAMLPPGVVGEVGIRTRAAFRGYWRDPAATMAAFHGDHVRTGDLGYLDADGYLFIVDRARDIIIRGGENIACQEIEAALYTHPAVAEACVYPLPDERLGEVPAATVHAVRGAGLSEGVLQSVAAEWLAAYKRPVRILISAEPLSRLGSGKIDRKTIRARSIAQMNKDMAFS